MASRRWLVLVFALLALALAGSSAASGFTSVGRAATATVTATHEPLRQDGLLPITPPSGVLTAVTRNQRQPLSKLLAAFVLIFTIAVVQVRLVLLRRPRRVITETPGPSIRRRGPPAACFSASI
jgi:hypothetical protein